MNISQWVSDSRKKLSRAELLCERANKLLQSSVQKVNDSFCLVNKAHYCVTLSKQKLRLLIIIRDSLSMSHDELLKAVGRREKKSDEVVSRMRVSIVGLKETTLDVGFGSANRALFDFVNEKDLEKLQGDMEMHLKELNAQCSALKIGEVVGLADSQVEKSQTRLDNLQNELDNLSAAKGSEIDLILQQNNAVELDMASLLESLTNHFDQCVKGASLLEGSRISTQERNEIVEILENDSQDLPHVMAELETAFSKVELNCAQINKECSFLHEFFQSKLKKYLSLLSAGIDNLLVGFDSMSPMLQRVQSTLHTLADEEGAMSELVEYFTNFSTTYHKTILEIQRRRDVNDQMARLVSRFVEEANQLRQQDATARKKFLMDNGNYIPSTMIEQQAGSLLQELPELKVLSTKEALPNVTQESVAEALRHLRL